MVPHVLSVRVCAPMEFREAVVMQRLGLKDRAAARRETGCSTKILPAVNVHCKNAHPGTAVVGLLPDALIGRGLIAPGTGSERGYQAPIASIGSHRNAPQPQPVQRIFKFTQIVPERVGSRPGLECFVIELKMPSPQSWPGLASACQQCLELAWDNGVATFFVDLVGAT